MRLAIGRAREHFKSPAAEMRQFAFVEVDRLPSLPDERRIPLGREAVESDGHTRSTCGVRELRDSPVRRSVWQRAAAARRPTSIVCWWRSGDAEG